MAAKVRKPVLRMCTGCGQMRPKAELVRVVKAPDRQEGSLPEISLDLTGVCVQGH